MSVDSDLIRSLVREALRDAVASKPELLRQAKPASVTEMVSLGNDADLARFVGRIADMCEDAATRAQLRSGAIAFSLAGASPASPVSGAASSVSTSGSMSGNVVVIEKGAVTESMVRKAAETGATLHLGPRAVLTSLAKDKARAMGVEIVKTSHNGKGAR